jgi:outer membrane protein TolC
MSQLVGIANQRHQAGVEQYLDVITARTTELTLEQTVIQLRGQRLATSVSSIKSLGAGRGIEAPAKWSFPSRGRFAGSRAGVTGMP